MSGLVKKASSTLAVGVALSQARSFPHTRMQWPVTLCFAHITLTSFALINSGLEKNLMDQDLAQQLECSLKSLKHPQKVMDIAGRPIAHVTHHTQSNTLVLSGNHREEISCTLIQSPHAPVVLGYPWLREHNPSIDWKLGQNSSFRNIGPKTEQLTFCRGPRYLPIAYINCPFRKFLPWRNI